jgi:hypothetical protein
VAGRRSNLSEAVCANVGQDYRGKGVPLLPILTYSDLGELLAKIKSLPKPLAGYVFSRNQQAIRPSVAIAFVRRGYCESDQRLLCSSDRYRVDRRETTEQEDDLSRCFS